MDNEIRVVIHKVGETTRDGHVYTREDLRSLVANEQNPEWTLETLLTGDLAIIQRSRRIKEVKNTEG